KQLRGLNDVGLKSLKSLPAVRLTFQHTHVLRRKDLIDLFDTTPDLAGNDIDIDRFIRDVEETDVRVFWRIWEQLHKNEVPPETIPAPHRDELCSAPIGSKASPGFRQFTEKNKGKVFRWNFLDKKWEKAGATRIAPGQVYLVHADAGGYTPECGWAPGSNKTVNPIALTDKVPAPDANDDDASSRIGIWQTIGEHTDEVCKELRTILGALSIGEVDVLHHAARWHDRGKVHEVFQNAIDDGQEDKRRKILRRARPKKWQGCRAVAKTPDKVFLNNEVIDPGWWRYYNWPTGGRRHFRHDLVAGLAVLDPSNRQIPDELRDMIAYLVAAHHGKVRLSVRSLPNETRPRDENGRPEPRKRFARGIWDGDQLPETRLGGGITAPAALLSLEPMELGLCEHPPFTGQPSWAERMIGLRDRYGPFHLALLETILRCADMRVSRAAGQLVPDNRAEAKDD
ncbi:CRISPR-associated endonuclease Cas3'', partial [Planctomycetota bacterium]